MRYLEGRSGLKVCAGKLGVSRWLDLARPARPPQGHIVGGPELLEGGRLGLLVNLLKLLRIGTPDRALVGSGIKLKSLQKMGRHDRLACPSGLRLRLGKHSNLVLDVVDQGAELLSIDVDFA